MPCVSKSGGLHLFLFLSEGAPAADVRDALRRAAEALGVGECEIFPKQDDLRADGTGNWMIMPYFGGTYGGKLRLQRGLKKTGAEMTLAEFLTAAESERTTLADLRSLLPATSELPPEVARAASEHVGKGVHDPEPVTVEKLRAALAVVPSDSYDLWVKLGLALHAELGDAGKELFVEWSARSAKYEEKQCSDKWDELSSKARGKVTGPTILWEADLASPGWRGGAPEQTIQQQQQHKRAKPEWEPVMVCVADVPPQEVVWLWRGRIARGKLTIIGGHPGISKSTLTIDMAARVTVGGPWPCGDGVAPKGSVVMLTSEDDVGDTIHPRLAAAGADVHRVHVLRGMKKQGSGSGRRGFDLTSDVAALEAVVRELGDVVMVIIDPVTAYMGKPGKLDSHRVTDVRAMLEPLQDVAARCGAAVIGINHLSKGGSAEALMRFLGSVGMVATSRASYLVARDKENPDRRLFLPAKNNLGDDRTGFAFKVAMKPTGYEKPPYAVAVEWEQETVSITADEALAAEAKDADGRRSEGAETAKKVISEMLRDGPRAAIEFEQRARDLSISEKSMRTAKRALGVRTTKKGKGGWEWYLPKQAQRALPMATGGPGGDDVF